MLGDWGVAGARRRQLTDDRGGGQRCRSDLDVSVFSAETNPEFSRRRFQGSNMSPVPSHEQLLADSAWLSRLAQSFVADPSTGEDLAQDTWLLAAHEGARGRAVGRGWLRETLRSRLWNLRRNEGNRHAREAEYAVHPHSPSALDLVARAELQQRVAEALTGLQEPLRTTALLRFLDGLSTAEIGKRMDVPADTVRDRLARAVTLLRNVLQPSDHRALAGFLPGSLATSLGASGAVSPTTWALGGVMMKKTVTVVAVVLVGVTARSQWTQSNVPPPLPSVPSVVDQETVEIAAPIVEKLAGVTDVRAAESQRAAIEAQSEVGPPAAPPAKTASSDSQPFRDALGSAYFEAEYRGWSREDLERERDKVYRRFMFQKKEALAERVEQGLETMLEKDADGKTIFNGAPQNKFYQTTSYKEKPADVYYVDLPFGLYSEVYDTGERWAWLMRASRRADK